MLQNFRTILVIVAALFAGSIALADDVQLVAVQMELNLDDFWTAEAFEAKIRSQLEGVAAQADPSLPTLVVFPEDVGLLLVVAGMEERLAGINSIETAIETAVTANVVPLLYRRLAHWRSWVPALFIHRNQIIAEAYFETFANLAREFEFTIVAGSVILPPYRITDGVVQWRSGPTEYNVYNTSYVFDPYGRVIGKQDKIDLIELEREAALNLTSGAFESLTVIETEVGTIGIAICLDSFSDEITNRLVELGADILVQPSANPGPWNEWQQTDWLRSNWLMVGGRAKFTYGVNPMLTGPLWDIEFFGQSSITASYASASDLGYTDLAPAIGFVAVAKDAAGEEILIQTVPHPDTLTGW